MKKQIVLLLFVISSLVLSNCTSTLAVPESSPEVLMPVPTFTILVPTLTATETSELPPPTTPTAPVDEKPTLPAPMPDPNSPRGTALQFYRWYLDAAAAGASPIETKSYQQSSYLADWFISEIDYLYAEDAGYDPFLCTDKSPADFTIDAVFQSGEAAIILIRTNLPDHYFLVETFPELGNWKIGQVECSSQPGAVVKAFFTWYFHLLIGDQDARANPESQNSLAGEELFRESGFLTDRLVQELETTSNASADPVFNAQTLPYEFWVQPGWEENPVPVRLQFGPRSARYIDVHLQAVNDGWLIDRLEHQQIPTFDPESGKDINTTDWHTYQDSIYGISFRYPLGWITEALKISSDYPSAPLVHSILIVSPETSTALKNTNRDPAARVVVPNLRLDILEGSAAEIENYYVTESHQVSEINGTELFIDREQGMVRYLLMHPTRPDTWFVFVDAVSEFKGREEQARESRDVLLPLLHSVEFQ